MARASYHFHQFKDAPQPAAFALEDYKKGLKQMRSALMNPTPNYMSTDHI